MLPSTAVSLEAKGLPGAGVLFIALVDFFFFLSAVHMSNYFLESCEILESEVSAVISMA